MFILLCILGAFALGLFLIGWFVRALMRKHRQDADVERAHIERVAAVRQEVLTNRVPYDRPPPPLRRVRRSANIAPSSPDVVVVRDDSGIVPLAAAFIGYELGKAMSHHDDSCSAPSTPDFSGDGGSFGGGGSSGSWDSSSSDSSSSSDGGSSSSSD